MGGGTYMCSFCNCVIWERINRWCNGSTDKSELERREFDSHWGFKLYFPFGHEKSTNNFMNTIYKFLILGEISASIGYFSCLILLLIYKNVVNSI